jgi:polyribonucleotide nucleotidyltransferase
MLGAVMFGHEQIQPVIKAIIEARREGRRRSLGAPEPTSRREKRRWRSPPKAACAPPMRSPRRSRSATPKIGEIKARSCRAADRRAASAESSPPIRSHRSFKELEPTSCAGTSSTTGSRASTAATPRRCGRSSPRSACCRARTARRCSPAARPRRWWCHARHRRGRADHRRAEGVPTRAFMLHYNFPPYSVGETGRMGSPGGARSATASSPGAPSRPMLPDKDEVPLHDPRGLGDHRVERLVLDGDGVRLLARADGRGRAAQARRSPASPWA